MDLTEAVIDNSYPHNKLDDILYIGGGLASKYCYAVAFKYDIGDPLKFSPRLLPDCNSFPRY